MNRTLEAMVRALFQSWFVDFDPVRSKQQGRQPPGLDPATAALFPESFEETELGKIPKGWTVHRLSELIELAYGKALKAENRVDGRYSVYGSNGVVGTHNERLTAGPGIVVGRKGNAGTVTWSPNDFFPIDTTFYVVPSCICRSFYFLYYALINQNLSLLGADSAVPGLNRNQVYASRQILPAPDVLEAFDRIVANHFSGIAINDSQSATLAALRDALLPKLLSGDLSVNSIAYSEDAE
jgi:type I restriction enzyme S subunit